LDYMVADFGVNSGPTRAIEHMQRALGVVADGHIGPKTMEALHTADVKEVIRRISESRLAFMRRQKTWNTFKNGWTIRVADVTKTSMHLVGKKERVVVAPPAPPAPVGNWFTRLIAAIFGRWK
ncbi:MAG: putative peptidoglycan-binding domain-containing protein, partial [Angustibacter sp.]